MSGTEFVILKENLTKRILSTLATQGYSEDENRKEQFVDRLRNITGTETTWNPDIFLVHGEGTVLAADVQLLERSGQYIPFAMEQAVPKMNADFDYVEVVLYTPMGAVLGPQTIRKAEKLDIAIDSIDQTGVIHRILEPPTVCQTYGADDDQKQAVTNQMDSRWVIPRVLVQELSNIENLEYSTHLQHFARDYFRTSTPVRLNAQYNLASQCIENIIRSYNLDLCCSPLQVTKSLQKMARRKGESRDHFLHEFQTFLMGALVLESCNGSSSPFVLCKRYPRMDLPWLLASIFHDFGFDLANLDSCIDVAIGDFRFESRVNLPYSSLLNSLYDFQRNNGDLDGWGPNSYVVRSRDLESILFSAAIERNEEETLERLRPNHGVLSAHEILNLEERVRGHRSGLGQAFISSALSVAFHDKALWAELFSHSIFPVDASRFPLIFLLILCDTLAEAGRPKTTNLAKQDAILTSFNVQHNVIHSAVWFSDLERACTMNFWTRFVQQTCFNNPPLRLECTSLL